jgi:hypothetical protein
MQVEYFKKLISLWQAASSTLYCGSALKRILKPNWLSTITNVASTSVHYVIGIIIFRILMAIVIKKRADVAKAARLTLLLFIRMLTLP